MIGIYAINHPVRDITQLSLLQKPPFSPSLAVPASVILCRSMSVSPSLLVSLFQPIHLCWFPSLFQSHHPCWLLSLWQSLPPRWSLSTPSVGLFQSLPLLIPCSVSLSQSLRLCSFLFCQPPPPPPLPVAVSSLLSVLESVSPSQSFSLIGYLSLSVCLNQSVFVGLFLSTGLCQFLSLCQLLPQSVGLSLCLYISL